MSQLGATPTSSNGLKPAKNPTAPAPPAPPDPEVVPRAKRRTFTTAYKERILAEADHATKPGDIGALLRREGLYSSNLTDWRRQRQSGLLGQRKRGKPAPDPSAKEVARLRRENERLLARLEKAEAIIDVQKKLSALLGRSLESEPKSSAR
jgi:transposase-like protein